MRRMIPSAGWRVAAALTAVVALGAATAVSLPILRIAVAVAAPAIAIGFLLWAIADADDAPVEPPDEIDRELFMEQVEQRAAVRRWRA